MLPCGCPFGALDEDARPVGAARVLCSPAKEVGPIHHVEKLDRDEFKHTLVAELNVAIVYVGYDDPLPPAPALRIHFPDLARLDIDHAPQTLAAREPFRSGEMPGRSPQPPVYSPLSMLLSSGAWSPSL